MNLRSKKTEIVITCPNCGQEYLPSEIYIPDNFFGNPESIYRDDAGLIEAYEGKPMDLEEEYVCDSCGEKFYVAATIRFKTISKQEKQFDPTYVSPLVVEKLNLPEDENE